jgi:hypothetical protein
MRKKAVFYLIFVLLFVVVTYFLTQKKAQKRNTQIAKKEMNTGFLVKLKSLDLHLTLDAKISLSDTIDLLFKVAGKLEKGEIDFQREKQFKKNQLLCQINNRNAFLQYLDEKKQFQNRCDDANKILEKLLSPTEMVKWKVFAASLPENQLIADFPVIKNQEEQKIADNFNLLKNYKEIKKTESNMSNYFYLAPFDGKIIENKTKVGQHIDKNQLVAKMVATSSRILKVEMDSSDFANIKSVQEIWVEAGSLKYELDWKTKTVVRNGAKVTLFFKGKNWNRFEIGYVFKFNLTGKTFEKYAVIPANMVRESTVKSAIDGSILRVKIQETFKDSMLVLGLHDGLEIIR